MAFGQDGSTGTSGWTFHTALKENSENNRVLTSLDSGKPARTLNRTAILSQVKAAASRHAQNGVLQATGLSRSDWNALFQAVIEVESGYNPTATSPKGAYGLGQLMPETARALGVDRHNIARYLLAQLARFFNVDLALAAYNAGPHRVIEHAGIPPFAETRAYIARVHHIRARLSGHPIEQSSKQASLGNKTRPTLVLDLN